MVSYTTLFDAASNKRTDLEGNLRWRLLFWRIRKYQNELSVAVVVCNVKRLLDGDRGIE